MDAETRREVELLALKMKEARASEVAFLSAAIEALEIALGHRDWETVVHVKATMITLADGLSHINAKAS